MRLCQILADRWEEIDAAYYQIDPPFLRQPSYRQVGLVYAWCIERVPSDKYDEWHDELRDLLDWQDAATSEAAVDLESQSFLAMQAKGGG